MIFRSSTKSKRYSDLGPVVSVGNIFYTLGLRWLTKHPGPMDRIRKLGVEVILVQKKSKQMKVFF